MDLAMQFGGVLGMVIARLAELLKYGRMLSLELSIIILWLLKKIAL